MAVFSCCFFVLNVVKGCFLSGLHRVCFVCFEVEKTVEFICCMLAYLYLCACNAV